MWDIMHNNWLQAIKDESGLTLIDMAVIMMVIGLLLYPFLQSRNLQIKEARLETTQGSLAQATEAIETYYLENGYYPCPADPTLSPDDANFGQENRLAPVAPAIVGLCTTDAGNADIPDPGDTVYYGALPFKALKLTEDQSIDAWNNKLTFAVTAAQTDPTTFLASNGDIVLEQDFIMLPHPDTGENVCTNTATQTPPGDETIDNIDVVTFSHGENGTGAYMLNGGIFAPCAAGADETPESENCNKGTNIKLTLCNENTNEGDSLFDDVVMMSGVLQETPSRIWDTATNPDNMGSIVGYIGVGNPAPERHIDVMGNILTESIDGDDTKNGNIHASEYCDTSGQACFDPKSISGSDPNMACENGNGMTGLGSNQAKCTNQISVGTTSSCPDGQYARGFNANGEVICGS